MLIGALAVLVARAVVAGSAGVLLRGTRERIRGAWSAVLVWGRLGGALSLVLAPHCRGGDRSLILALTVGTVMLSLLGQERACRFCCDDWEWRGTLRNGLIRGGRSIAGPVPLGLRG